MVDLFNNLVEGMMNSDSFLVQLISIMIFFLLLSWALLPIAIWGIKSKMDKIINELNEISNHINNKEK